MHIAPFVAIIVFIPDGLFRQHADRYQLDCLRLLTAEMQKGQVVLLLFQFGLTALLPLVQN